MIKRIPWPLSVILLACGVMAIRPASDADMRAIHTKMNAALMMDRGIKAKENQLQAAMRRGASQDEMTNLRGELLRMKGAQSAERTKAIHLTLTAYDLWPENRKATSVMHWTKGRTIHWIPVAREKESRSVQNKNGEEKNLAPPKDMITGVTYQDGVSHIVPETFNGGPGYLASVLLHERTHYEQMTTPGKGEAYTIAKADAEAYRTEFENSKYFFDPIRDKNHIDWIESQWRTNAAVADQQDRERGTLRGRLKEWLTPAERPDFFNKGPHRPEELEAIRRDFDDLGAIVASEMAAAAREREVLENHRRDALERANRAPDIRDLIGTAPEVERPREEIRGVEAGVPPGGGWTLQRLAVKTCANPSGLDQADLSALSWWTRYDCGPLESLRDELSGCARSLFGELTVWAGRGRVLTVDWLRAREGALRDEGPSDVPGENNSPDEGSGRGRRKKEDSGVGDGSGRARDQAGRIGRTGRWPK